MHPSRCLLFLHSPPPPQVLVFCEICHNVRKSFHLQQLAQVVSFMACSIADRAQMYHNQSTCVRLSLNLVECLYQVSVEARSIHVGCATTLSQTTSRRGPNAESMVSASSI
jgi:hypothetical protein